MIYLIAIIFIGFDILTGIVKGLKNEGLNSAFLRSGLFKKLAEIFSLALSTMLEYGIKYINLDVEIPLVISVSIYIIIMETISIIENICELNPDMLNFYKKYLYKFKEKEGKNNDESR